jgi:HK97 family phage portal protein
MKFSANGGKPSGILSFENEISPETRENLRLTWDAKFGPGGAGGIAVLDGKTEFQPMTMSLADSQFIENRRFQIEEIARAFSIQPIMLMQQVDAASYGSAEQMFRVHVTHTLMPWIKRFEEALNRDVLNNSDEYYFDFDERALLRGDHQTQAEYYQKALGSGGVQAWMTVNEVRQELGLNPSTESWANELSIGGYAAQSSGSNK